MIIKANLILQGPLPVHCFKAGYALYFSRSWSKNERDSKCCDYFGSVQSHFFLAGKKKKNKHLKNNFSFLLNETMCM